MAVPCCSGGKLSSRMDCASGCMPPPPTPCSTRATISMGMFRDMPQSMEAPVKARMESMQQALAADAARDPARGGQHDGIRDQIAGEHPGGFVGGRREAAGDVRQGDVGDGGVEHHHEGGQHHRRRPSTDSTEGRHRRTLRPPSVMRGLLVVLIRLSSPAGDDVALEAAAAGSLNCPAWASSERDRLRGPEGRGGVSSE